jgi:hypothetical protein
MIKSELVQLKQDCELLITKINDLIEKNSEQYKIKKVYVLYSCGTWHSQESKFLLGVFERDSNLINFAIEHSIKSEEGTLLEHDRYLLKNISQTQNRSENYIYECVELNPLFV